MTKDRHAGEEYLHGSMYHCTVIASLGLMQVAPFWGFRHHRDSEYSLYVYGFEAVLYGTCGLDGCSAVQRNYEEEPKIHRTLILIPPTTRGATG